MSFTFLSSVPLFFNMSFSLVSTKGWPELTLTPREFSVTTLTILPYLLLGTPDSLLSPHWLTRQFSITDSDFLVFQYFLHTINLFCDINGLFSEFSPLLRTFVTSTSPLPLLYMTTKRIVWSFSIFLRKVSLFYSWCKHSHLKYHGCKFNFFFFDHFK